MIVIKKDGSEELFDGGEDKKAVKLSANRVFETVSDSGYDDIVGEVLVVIHDQDCGKNNSRRCSQCC